MIVNTSDIRISQRCSCSLYTLLSSPATPSTNLPVYRCRGSHSPDDRQTPDVMWNHFRQDGLSDANPWPGGLGTVRGQCDALDIDLVVSTVVRTLLNFLSSCGVFENLISPIQSNRPARAKTASFLVFGSCRAKSEDAGWLGFSCLPVLFLLSCSYR
ncbi:hypothetical protein LZ30DRAFT_729915 [Colletotrichum cereale]|nr:hypothetical protein LZ30DRAFT_729915 [Colletotrichum cereale]